MRGITVAEAVAGAREFHILGWSETEATAVELGEEVVQGRNAGGDDGEVENDSKGRVSGASLDKKGNKGMKELALVRQRGS